jgi:hypothetical protein
LFFWLSPFRIKNLTKPGLRATIWCIFKIPRKGWRIFMNLWLRRALVTLLCLFLSVSVFGFTDADGDGMDDDWEKKFELDPTNPMDADLDNDGDKVSNLDEYKKGTDPNDGKDRNGNGIPDDWRSSISARPGLIPKAMLTRTGSPTSRNSRTAPTQCRGQEGGCPVDIHPARTQHGWGQCQWGGRSQARCGQESPCIPRSGW